MRTLVHHRDQMVKFEPRDPFPLLTTFSKSEALAHATACDRWLGLQVEETEKKLSRGGSNHPAPVSSGRLQQLWFGLAPQDLQTPYLELRPLLESNLPDTKSLVVDLGAAYARTAFVIERHFPQAWFLGFEYVGERVEEARRALKLFEARRSRIEHADLTSPQFKLPAAQVYLIYDYGTPAAIEKTLYDIKRVTEGREVTLIARGRVTRYAIESRHAFWLSKKNPIASESAVTVYSTTHLNFNRVKSSVEHGV